METEFEQLIKRLDWLDEERRKDKTTIALMGERLGALESSLNVSSAQVKELSGKVSLLSTLTTRVDQYDKALGQHRLEINRFIEDIEKRREAAQREANSLHRNEIDDLNKSIAQTRKSLDAIKDIKREIKNYNDEEIRRNRAAAELASKFEDVRRTSEEIQRAQQVADEAHRREVKRLTDVQGEITAMRKRVDEIREKADVLSDNSRRLEIRLTELLASESDRRQSQINFIETQSRVQVERDRTWKEWETRFENLTKQSETLENQLRDWDAAQRAVKHAQETYDEIVQKFERRINEIAEMQRLGEDRSRQEWVTFKADDQKRWTSYTLSQDEVHKDTRADVDKLAARLTLNEDLAQTQKDILQQTKDANEQMLQALLAQIHELLAAYERIMGTAK